MLAATGEGYFSFTCDPGSCSNSSWICGLLADVERNLAADVTPKALGLTITRRGGFALFWLARADLILFEFV